MPGRFEGKQALVLGVANKRSIAWAIAERLASEGAQLAFTYQGERIEKSVRDLAETVDTKLVTECDVRSDEDLDRVFAETADAFGGGLDLLVHSVAFAAAEDLEGRFTDTPRGPLLAGGRHQRVLARRVLAAGGAADGVPRGRLDRDDDLPRRRAGRAALQRDGRREGDARRVDAVPRVGPRPEASGSTRSPPARSGRSPRARSRASRRWRRCSSSARRSTATSTRATAAPRPPTSSRTTRRTSPARRSTSTPGTTRWACRGGLEVGATRSPRRASRRGRRTPGPAGSFPSPAALPEPRRRSRRRGRAACARRSGWAGSRPSYATRDEQRR